MSKFQSYEPSELMDYLEDGAVKKAKKYINQFFFKTFKGIYFHNTVEDKFELLSDDELNSYYLTPDMATDSKNPFVPYIYMFGSEPPIYYKGEFESKEPVMNIIKKGKTIKYINLGYSQYIVEEKEEPQKEEPLRAKKPKKRNKKKKDRDNNRNIQKPKDEDKEEEEFREALNQALEDF